MRTVALPALPPAEAPAEARGLERSDVALLIARRTDGTLCSARFEDLVRFLLPGDLLVVNTSATLAAAVRARWGQPKVTVVASEPEKVSL